MIAAAARSVQASAAVGSLVRALSTLLQAPSLTHSRSVRPSHQGHAGHHGGTFSPMLEAHQLWPWPVSCSQQRLFTDVAGSSNTQLPSSVRLTSQLEARLQRIAARAEQLSAALSGGADGEGDGVGSSSSSSGAQGGVDPARLACEYGAIQVVAEQYTQYKNTKKELAEAEALTRDSDPEVAALAKEEVQQLAAKVRQMEEGLLLSLLPGRQDEERDAIIEVRAGTGGAEASLFAAELMSMYERFATARGCAFEMLEVSQSEAGGVRTASASVTGAGAYGRLRWEAGVHRVQRVPVTETQGRIHTSTATVVVLPQAEESEVVLRDADVRVDTMRASGAGGQHVNTTSSAVRLTHLPTGIVVTCQDERSQLRNRALAFKVLRARLFESQRRAAEERVGAARRAQAGTAERNERIRTYNFAQDRMTDHRVNLTHHGLDEVMSGAIGNPLEAVHEALNANERSCQLEQLVSEGVC